MIDLTDFPIARRWPPQHPDRIQLYSYPTPNGVKASIALEEMELPYEAHRVDVVHDEARTEPFLSLNPNGKIPAIIDPDGPGGRPLALFESGAILLYLAEKSDRLLPIDPARRYEAIQWLFFQAAHVGPSFGSVGWLYCHASGRAIEDPRPLERFRLESIRLLAVLERRLAGRQWIMDDEYSIADVQLFDWVRATRDRMNATELLGLADFPETFAWADRAAARPASVRGLSVPHGI